MRGLLPRSLPSPIPYNPGRCTNSTMLGTTPTYAIQPWPEFRLPLFFVLWWPSSFDPWPSVLQFKKISGQFWLLWWALCW